MADLNDIQYVNESSERNEIEETQVLLNSDIFEMLSDAVKSKVIPDMFGKEAKIFYEVMKFSPLKWINASKTSKRSYLSNGTLQGDQHPPEKEVS